MYGDVARIGDFVYLETRAGDLVSLPRVTLTGDLVYLPRVGDLLSFPPRVGDLVSLPLFLLSFALYLGDLKYLCEVGDGKYLANRLSHLGFCGDCFLTFTCVGE